MGELRFGVAATVDELWRLAAGRFLEAVKK